MPAFHFIKYFVRSYVNEICGWRLSYLLYLVALKNMIICTLK